MHEEEKQIVESLRLCAKVPIKCDGCVETFEVGCATRLREKAADTIERLIASAEPVEPLRRSDGTGKSEDVFVFDEMHEDNEWTARIKAAMERNSSKRPREK